ncbi:hypothetical protein ACFLZ7_00420 [Nanoarchaeota archaeon]
MRFGQDKKFYLVFIAVILISVIFHVKLLSDFNQLPSPIYGGDYYHQMGAIEHVKQGGNAFTSFATFNDEVPSYFPLYALIVGNLSRIFGIEAMTAMFVFSVIIQLLAILIIYLLVTEITNNRKVSLLTTILLTPLSIYPIIKYASFTKYTLYPLFFLFLIKFLKNKNWKNAIYAGLLYGLNSISHGSGFLTLTLLFPFLFIYLFLIEKGKILNVKQIKEKLKCTLPIFLSIFLIGFIIAQLYWFTPLTFEGDLPNKITDWAQSDYSEFSVQAGFIGDIFKSFFFNFNGVINSIVSLASILAILFLFVVKSKSKEFDLLKKLSIFFLISFTLISLHFIVTIPLFGLEFSPHYMLSFFTPILHIFLISFSFKTLLNIKKIKENLIYVFIIFILLFSVIGFNEKVNTNKWIQAGFQEINPVLIASSKAIKDGTDLNAHFISTKETGSAINALTGRKFLSIRRNQHPVTSEVDQRELDLALILYSNNDSIREKLLETYEINYLYWDYYWINSEFQFDNEGVLKGYFDPIMIIYTPEREEILSNNGVNFKKEYMVIDSSKRNLENIKKFNVLVVYPAQLDATHPWHSNLDKYLTEIWKFEQNEQIYARLFEIKR